MIEGIMRSPFDPRMLGPPLLPSLARGVGKAVMMFSMEGRMSPTLPAAPPRFEPYDCAVGVGSKDKESLSLVWGAKLGGGV
jgi:hypothetical protein